MADFARAAAPLRRSVSSSRQFVVYGDEIRLRGALCDAAERSKRDVLRILGQRDEWKSPIVLRVDNSPPTVGAPLAQLHVSQTGAGLKFQLELSLVVDGSSEVERELLRVIFLEIMYRQQPDLAAGAPFVEPPDWLLEGTGALSPGRDFTPLAQALATAASHGSWDLAEFLRQKRALLDSPSRILFRAYSAAFVSMLLDAPDGRARLSRYVADFARAGNDPLADLSQHFPGIGETAEQVEQTWRAQVTRLAGRERHRLLGWEETERELAGVLRINLPNAKPPLVYGLDEFPQFLREPGAEAELKRLQTELLLLSARADPLHRPIVAQYQQITARLLVRKTKKIPQRLAEMRSTREHLRRKMSAIEDYMNWFEATQANTASGAFREYLRAAELAQKPEVRRRDPISVYLDALETQF